MIKVFSILALVATSLLAQTPASGTTGSVSGRVVDAETRMPVQGASVGSQKLGWTLTDGEGRYTIRGLAPGRVSIGMNYEAGANIDDIPAIPRDVTVTAGHDTTGIDFKPWLDARLSGRVYDANNEPLTGIRVSVFYRYYRSGELIVSSLTTTTDDLGV